MLTPEQIAEGWVEHDGGPCPVPLDSRVGLMFGPDADGFVAVFRGPLIAKWHTAEFGPDDWQHKGRQSDRIFAYRPEPRHD